MRSKYIPKNTLHDIMQRVPPQTRLMLEVALQTGLRIGDVVQLKRGDIRGTTIVKKAQKTGKVGRWEITPELRDKLLKNTLKTPYLFPGRDRKKHVTRQTPYRHIKRACQILEIDPRGISPHSLRKDYAVGKMRADGFKAAQEGLQHANPAVTRIYAYADTMLKADTDEPIRWSDVELLVDYVLSRLNEKLEKGQEKP